jgi:hypothetical protein
MENLMDGLLKEIARNRELLEHYKKIGIAGNFGRIAIQRDIDAAEKAIKDNDVVEMVQAYQNMINNE